MCCIVIVIVLLVVVVCVIVRYRRKRSQLSVAGLSTDTDIVPNNAAAISAANKEKNLFVGVYDNPTYAKCKENDDIFLAPQNYEVPQNYEIPDGNIYDEVPH